MTMGKKSDRKGMTTLSAKRRRDRATVTCGRRAVRSFGDVQTSKPSQCTLLAARVCQSAQVAAAEWVALSRLPPSATTTTQLTLVRCKAHLECDGYEYSVRREDDEIHPVCLFCVVDERHPDRANCGGHKHDGGRCIRESECKHSVWRARTEVGEESADSNSDRTVFHDILKPGSCP